MAAAAATDPAFQQVELDMYRLAGEWCRLGTILFDGVGV
jgi:hypothetical protein